MNWFRSAKAPAAIRLDSEGAFKSQEFRVWCAVRGIEAQMVAGEAHWQIGSVETHIRLLKNQLSLMEDELPDASIDELVEHCVTAKVRRQTDTVRYSGGSEHNVPVKWKNRDLEKIYQVLNDDCNFRQLPKQPLFLPTLGRPCVWPSMRDHVH